jgi:hypothetical protein
VVNGLECCWRGVAWLVLSRRDQRRDGKEKVTERKNKECEKREQEIVPENAFHLLNSHFIFCIEF